MHQLQQFFVGKKFVIPTYQRDYAWGIEQLEDLLEDIGEAIQDNHSHYLGTIVLARRATEEYEVVDGQQRISTLMLVIAAFLGQLDKRDSNRIATESIFIREGDDLRLDFGVNHNFVSSLLNHDVDANTPDPETAGQRNLLGNHRHCMERAQSIRENLGDEGIVAWINAIKTLKIISFEEENTGSAIRLFQTVNDRGLPLTVMDKSKALLVYYSNRFLEGALDDLISESFGRCFRAYDDIVEFVRHNGFKIDSIAREAFSDNELMRYHYLSYYPPDDLSGVQCVNDYDGYMRTVFDAFLKGSLKSLNQAGVEANEREQLSRFIEDYVVDLADFCEAFRDLVIACADDSRVYKLLVVLGLSVRLYPLTIRAFQRGILFDEVPGSTVSLLECIEIADLRVYKTRGTDPGKHVGDISHESRFGSLDDMARGLQEFVRSFASDGSFQANLGGDIYRNRGLVYFLLSLEESRGEREHSVRELKELNRKSMTREHILAQAPGFGLTEMGFDDQEDYDMHKNLLGNLTLLTQSENSTCSNKNPAEKLGAPDLYAASQYRITRDLAHKYAEGELRANKTMVRDRGSEMIEWAITRWPIWEWKQE